MDQEGDQTVVDEEKVDLFSEFELGEVWEVEEGGGSLDAVDHDHLVLAHVLDVLVHGLLGDGLLGVPVQLQGVEDLPDVVSGGDDDLVEAFLVDRQGLEASDLRDASVDLVLLGFHELDVKAVICEGFELLVIAVVADADDGGLGVLDDLDDGGYAATVRATHAVDLIHDDHALFVLIGRVLGCLFEVVERLVRAEGFDKLVD